MIRTGFIGAGVAASALAAAINGKGYLVVAVSSRSRKSADKLAQLTDGCRAYGNNQAAADAAELIFITTPDHAIASVAAGVRWRPEHSVVHCSGADSTDILAPAREDGAAVGVFHPLQTFSGSGRQNLLGITYAIEADEPLLTKLRQMAAALGGHHIELKAEDKALYHTAAVFACNYLVTLFKLSTDLWQAFGISPNPAARALLPLMRGTLNNLESVGLPQCLTGPIARGDSGTIKKHLSTLQMAAPELETTYRELGLKTIPIALAKGKIDGEQADEIEAILRP